MLPKFHVEITRQALQNLVSAPALKVIIAANVYQDRLSGQIGHDEFHFDNNAFEQGYAYIEAQRTRVIDALCSKDIRSAWSAFGRLTHTAQDFYAHSNYISLWLTRRKGEALPMPRDVDPLDPDLLASHALRSGRIYFPLELFSFIGFLKPLVMPMLPRDSHAWMNLDSPAQGPSFGFAFQAAVKRTQVEFEKTKAGMSSDQLALFTDYER